jgi:3-oxoacyl-[acyl-carrier protein] reductase
MDLGLKGRVAVVCGSSEGIGLAIAESLADEGANVAMFARRRDVLEREAERIGALAVRGDIRDPRDLDNLVDRTLEAFGGIDILVNNGGGPSRGTAREADATALEDAVELLLLSAVRLTLRCLPHLERSGHGRVITTASSSVREPIENLALSNAVRPGVVGWMKTLAREVGPSGITVNMIATGRVDTARIREVYPEGPTEEDLKSIPQRRLATTRDLGDVVTFLATDQAAYIIGALIPVDGGLTRGLI